jgi:hypothetical protein
MANQKAIDFVYLITQNNVEVMPLQGKDGKHPRVQSYRNKTIHHGATIRLLEADKISTYAIRLSGLTVIDVDSDPKDWDHVVAVQSLLGRSSFIVETGRGYHLYYRGEKKFKNPFAFKAEIKSGWNSYVVGPHSVRPDGVVYEPILGNFIEPPLTDCNVPTSLLKKSHTPSYNQMSMSQNGKVRVGDRHNYLLSASWRLADECLDEEELAFKLKWHAVETCVDAENITMKELEDIASWMWGKQYYGKRYSEEFSEVKISRSVIKRLIGLSGASDALALYVFLSDKHRHTGKDFAINFSGMKKAQLTDLGRDRFNRAKKLLLELGHIQQAKNYKVGSRPNTYRFP